MSQRSFVQRRWTGGAQVLDSLARRRHESGDVAAGIHAAAGGVGDTYASLRKCVLPVSGKGQQQQRNVIRYRRFLCADDSRR